MRVLVVTFDDMLERSDESFAGQRHFVDNAPHELRTPLAINRTALEVALADPEASGDTRRLARTLLATNDRGQRLVDGLLLLARSDNEVAERRPVDLAEVGGRLDNGRTRSDRGVGLGPSIVRSIVRAHHGEISAEPRPEGGLTVRVRLPALSGAERPPTLIEAAS